MKTSWQDKRIHRLNKKLYEFRKDFGELTVPLDETIYFDEYQNILNSKAETEEEYLHNKENKIDIWNNNNERKFRKSNKHKFRNI